MSDFAVDPAAVEINDSDVATWLLFFLESHGADVRLTDDDAVSVALDSMFGIDEVKARHLAPIIVRLIPEMREILKARRLMH